MLTEVFNFFLELELKEGVGGLQVQKTLAQILTGAGAGSSGWAWSGSVPHHPLLSLPLQGIKGILHQKIFYRLNLIFYHLALSLEVPSDYQGPGGTAPNDKSLKSFISAPQ